MGNSEGFFEVAHGTRAGSTSGPLDGAVAAERRWSLDFFILDAFAAFTGSRPPRVVDDFTLKRN